MTFFNHTYIGIADTIHSARGGSAVIETILERLSSDASDSSVLDVGCGYGRISLPLASHVRAVVGVDRSRALIAEAQERATAAGAAGSCMFVLADAARLPLRSSFDVVLMLDSVLGCDEDADLALMDSAWSALRPGGFLFCSSLNMVAVARHLTADGTARFLVEVNGDQVVDEVSYCLDDGSLRTVRLYAGSDESQSLVVQLWDPSSWIRFGHSWGFDDIRVTALDGTRAQMDTPELLIGMRRPTREGPLRTRADRRGFEPERLAAKPQERTEEHG